MTAKFNQISCRNWFVEFQTWLNVWKSVWKGQIIKTAAIMFNAKQYVSSAKLPLPKNIILYILKVGRSNQTKLEIQNG